MGRWSVGLLRVVFAFVIAFLAGVVSVSVSAIFHSHSGLLSGIRTQLSTPWDDLDRGRS
jgi:hypothetical protein